MKTIQEPQWRRSSTCTNANCVEAAKVGHDTYLIRDSKRPEDPALTFTTQEWAAFKAGVAAGEFEF